MSTDQFDTSPANNRNETKEFHLFDIKDEHEAATYNIINWIKHLLAYICEL
jgi:hypothetical protein